MTLRETQIETTLLCMELASTPARREILNELIDQAEAGKLREPLPVHLVGMSGEKTV